MTVTVSTRDSPGTTLNSKVSAMSTVAGALANGPAKVYANAELDREQQRLVDHLMATGRLSAASILSTMT